MRFEVKNGLPNNEFENFGRFNNNKDHKFVSGGCGGQGPWLSAGMIPQSIVLYHYYQCVYRAVNNECGNFVRHNNTRGFVYRPYEMVRKCVCL